MDKKQTTRQLEPVTTRIWQEVSQADDPFVAQQCICSGFDVYGDLLGNIHSMEYLMLLISGEPPCNEHLTLLNDLAVSLGNPGPRDHSVQAAMSAGAGGSSLASALMAALAVGAGGFGGAREVLLFMQLWERCGTNQAMWADALGEFNVDNNSGLEDHGDAWRKPEYPPGFVPHTKECSAPVLQTLAHLATVSRGECLPWLNTHRKSLETSAGLPLSMTAVAASTFLDLGLDAEQGEALYLLLRLPGALAHGLEQKRRGWQDYPFHSDGLVVTNS